MENIVVIGSSGHAKVIIDIIRQEGKYHLAGLVDQFRAIDETTLGYGILGGEADLPGLVQRHALQGIIIAIGDNFTRAQVAAQVRMLYPELRFVCAVHPKASVAMGVSLGAGTVVMAGASISACCSVGEFCILNTNCSLDHDSTMEDFSSLAPRTATGGSCRIGAYAAIGIGAVLTHGVEIGEHSVIGAASLVRRSIPALVVAYGTPAQVIRRRSPGDKYL
ncbi:MAG: acetyltransferase [Synechococcales cyanobacterium RM1_1_8]|nr:acetyltransferase [Synechococcales cyanobacterium RM1_1_8]